MWLVIVGTVTFGFLNPGILREGLAVLITHSLPAPRAFLGHLLNAAPMLAHQVLIFSEERIQGAAGYIESTKVAYSIMAANTG